MLKATESSSRRERIRAKEEREAVEAMSSDSDSDSDSLMQPLQQERQNAHSSSAASARKRDGEIKKPLCQYTRRRLFESESACKRKYAQVKSDYNDLRGLHRKN
jgi:hypothetical protein